MSRILIVDDEPSICWGLTELLGEEGHAAEAVGSAEAALEVSDDARPDLLLLDVRLPGQDGLSAIPRLRGRFGEIPIVVVTAFGDLTTAVRAVEAGAADYLCKPLNADDVSAVVRRALDQQRPTQDGAAAVDRAATHPVLIGGSAAMQRVFRQIALAAAADVPVLVTGESGTGKELISRAIHEHSARSQRQFIPVSLPALNSGLVEAELFGHERGAFTGADVQRPGLLDAAAGGTVFLDEIGDTPLEVQVKMLRAIEYHEVIPVGGVRPRQVDFRVIAATNRSLAELVRQGRFREDLFYRLHVFVITAPPLRDRREDIPLLATHFLGRMKGGPCAAFSAASLAELRQRDWHGNVRELRNAVEHAAVLARGGRIDVDHLPPPLAGWQSPVDPQDRLARRVEDWLNQEFERARSEGFGREERIYPRFLAAVERPLLEKMLSLCDGNRTTAAALLGLHRSTLRQKLRDLGLS